jgi:hypothetical protein
MIAETIAKVLGGRKAGDGWMVCCPAHGDRESNLSIRDTDGGKVLVRCHAGCDQERVVAALRSLGLWEEHVDPAGSRAPRLVPLPATARIKAAPSMSRVVDGYPMPRRSSDKPLPARRKRRYNVRRIKATWPYSVQEIAGLFAIHKNAVLRWLKEGLTANRDQRPFLIRGDELTRFLTARQNGNRQKCAPDEFFCFKCRTPRGAYLGMADIVIESPTRLRVKALCGICDTLVNKVQSVRNLEQIKTRFDVQQLTGEHLLECAAPSLNSDLET